MTDIGGECDLKHLHNNKPAKKKPRSMNKYQEEEKKLKVRLKFVCDHWKYWKLQIR